MTTIKLTDREITIETKGRQVRLVWDEHMQECIAKSIVTTN